MGILSKHSFCLCSDRDLATDLGDLKAGGVKTIVCLLNDAELRVSDRGEGLGGLGFGEDNSIDACGQGHMNTDTSIYTYTGG